MVVAFLVVGALVMAFKFSRLGLETPEYKVLKKEGGFEIREYPSVVVVSTPMEGPDPSKGTSFKRLFRYISGENQAKQKISMTTPVFTSQEKLGRQMSFVVPKDIVEKGAPEARSKVVRIDTMVAGKFAVYRFSGSWDAKRFEDAKLKLTNWVLVKQLSPTEEPMVANYDPPFTPSFLKRNEVLVRLSAKD
jgi:DNA gyrase inhibitor GyrI